jgi:hypothetical protein
MSELETRREEIRRLLEKRARGDIREKDFQAALAEGTVALYRARVQALLVEGEQILAEHHVVFGHTRLGHSVLKEPEQQALSLFATPWRLLRLRSTLIPGVPATCDDRDHTLLDELPFDRIQRLQVRRQVRTGEVVTGLAILGIALVFRSWLALTGPVLAVLGLLGALHGLVLPTRWIEVCARGPGSADPITIPAVRRKSGRKLVDFLRQKIRHPTG